MKVVVTFTSGESLMLVSGVKSVRINPITNCVVVRFQGGIKNVFPLENVQRIETQ